MSLKLYDALGREIRTLVDEVQGAGHHQVTLNANGLASGMYFYRIRAGSLVETMSLLLVR